MNRSFIRILITCPAFAFTCIGSAMAADCAPPTLLNSLPMEQMPGNDTMTVPVTIDGRSAKLLIGIADGSQLWNAQAQTLGLALLEHGNRMMDGGGRFSEAIARVESLSLGSMQTGNFVTQIGADPDFAGADGVLGTDMMMRYDIDLDFAHRKLNYFTPEHNAWARGVYWALRQGHLRDGDGGLCQCGFRAGRSGRSHDRGGAGYHRRQDLP